jgi:hypothetical protein
MDDVVELIVVIPTSPRSSKTESECKSYRCFHIARSSWADYPAHFWKYPAKYPALNLNDAREVLSSLGVGGAEYPVQTWIGISGPAVQQRLHSREGYKYPSPSSSLG